MSTRDRLRRLLAEATQARRYLLVALACELVVTGLILAQAGLLAHLLAGGGIGGGSGAFGGLLAVVVGRAGLCYGGEVAAQRAAIVVKERLRSRLLSQVLDLGPGWLSRQRSGEITTLATTGLDSLDSYFAQYLPQLVLAVAVPVAVVSAVAAADWISALIVAVTLPVIPVFAVLIGWHTSARTRQSWRLLARLSGHFLDVVQGLPTLKIFGRAKAQEKVIAEITEEYRTSVMATLRVAFLSALVLELAAAVATALVAVEVGLRLLYGHMEYATALFVLLLTPEAFLPVRNAAARFHASADGTAAAGQVFEIADAGRPTGRRCRGVVPDLGSDVVRFDEVAVRYPDRDEPAISRCDLIIRPGDQITLIGDNGAGKSTLLAVLLKFVEPARGRVLAGEVALSEVPPDEWRHQIGWLPQHPAMFGWSVAENIALGRPGAARAEVERAAARAGAAEFIAALPEGYDTVLDERGLRLSAGERQKIALARLFCKDARMILLDEPTAHLDQASASDVTAAISELSAGRTVVVVTHRLDGLADPGRVLRVADGRLRDLGQSAGVTEVAGAGW